jgi:hypothetical protein
MSGYADCAHHQLLRSLKCVYNFVSLLLINKSHNKSFQVAIVLFLDQKFKIYMGGVKFLKGGDIPRRFAPLGGAIFLGDSPRGGGANILGISPPFWEGGRISCDTGIYFNNLYLNIIL